MMNKFKWVLLLSIIILSCNKKNGYDYPLVFTGDVNNITHDGAYFNAKIVNLSNSEITAYGFVWDSIPEPNIENSEKYLIKDAPAKGVFSAGITSVLQTGVKYYVRAFISNGSYTTYGLPVTFMSLGSMAPKIIDFMPKNANLDDTLMIIGAYFSRSTSKNVVQFGDFPAKVLKATPDTLWVTVPNSLNAPSSPISVSVIGNVATSTELFNLIPPVITDFNAKFGSIGSQVTIDGKNFASNTASIKVYFDKYLATTLSIQDNKINVLVPGNLDKRPCNISVTMNNLSVVSANQFTLGPLTLTDFTPKRAKTGSTIIITGTNFSPLIYSNKVTIGGFNAVVTKASANSLEVTIPSQVNRIYPSRNVIINVSALGESKDFNTTLEINDQWFRLHDAPIGKRNQMDINPFSCFLANDKAYIGLELNSEFWEYTPATDKWKRLADFPGANRSFAAGFIIDNKLYFGTGYTSFGYGGPNAKDLGDWWEYDIATNTWTRKNDFPGGARSNVLTYQYANISYMGAGTVYMGYYNNKLKDFWKYNPTDDSWTKVIDHPVFNEFNTGLGFTYRIINDVCYGIKTTSTYQLWISKYDPDKNTWQRIPDFSSFTALYNIGFSVKENLYMHRGSTNYELLYYKDGASNWEDVGYFLPYNFDTGLAFTIKDKAYIGLSFNNVLWEFDPSR